MSKSIRVQSPGRINIIGEHTDYNMGYVLPAAIDKNIHFHLKKNGSNTVRVKANNFGESHTFVLDNFKPIEGGWPNYVMGVVSELQKLGTIIEGFDLEFEGTIPMGSGMSSSAALECGLAYGLNELFNLKLDKIALIKASQMAEHHFVGTKCGIMDQFASMMGKKDQVLLLDCRSLNYEYFPLDLGDYQLVLLNTLVTHNHATSEYNTRRAECEAGVQVLQSHFPTIQSLRDVNLNQLESVKTELSPIQYRRCRHVITDNTRVLAATEALQQGNIAQLGELLYASHKSLSEDYAVSCEQSDFLVEFTFDKKAILGARQMGGGFGGCTLNIVHKAAKSSFIEMARKAYLDRFDIELEVYEVAIENGTGLLQ